MAYEIHGHGAFSRRVASQVAAGQAVAHGAGDHTVVPATGPTHPPLGVALTNASVGRDVTVHVRGNIVRARAAASVGYGGFVGVVAGTSSLGPASGAGNYKTGIAQQSAQAGDIFSVLVDPERLAA